jgi:anti-sigma factor RsiW
MNVCAKNRKALAWLALGLLEENPAQALRAHLASCAGCRAYLAEMERVAENVRAAEAPPDLEPSPFFHRRVRRALRPGPPRPAFHWRLALPALALLLFLLLTLARTRPVAPPAAAAGNFDPTILNYEIAADQSLEKLDKLLTEQGNRAVPAAPIYRAGSFPRGSLAD